jgi:hypothetical protein
MGNGRSGDLLHDNLYMIPLSFLMNNARNTSKKFEFVLLILVNAVMNPITAFGNQLPHWAMCGREPTGPTPTPTFKSLNDHRPYLGPSEASALSFLACVS